MKVVLVSRDSIDLWKHEYIRTQVLNSGVSSDVKIICGERVPELWQNKAHILYIYEGRAQFKDSLSESPNPHITKLQTEQAEYTYGSLYRADNRYLNQVKDERELAIEQIFLVNKAKQFFEEYNADYLFMTGGGNLIRNAIYVVAKKLGIKSYRILNVTYLNPDRKGVRYWFCSNNYCRLSTDPADIFHHPVEELKRHAEDLIAKIEEETYKLDRYARTIGSSKRSSIQLKAIVEDLQLLFLRRSKAAKARGRKRLKSGLNFLLNRGLCADPAKLPEPFVLFPLNVPEDAQIVLRAPYFREGLSICEQIASVLPYGYHLVIKEHPGHPGMLEHSRLKFTLRNFPNVLYLDSRVSIEDVLSLCTAVITINSTAAINALVNGLPVITMGEAFYKGTGLTYDVENLLDLKHVLTQLAQDPLKDQRKETMVQTISSLLQETVPEPNVFPQATEEKCVEVIAQGVLTKIRANL